MGDPYLYSSAFLIQIGFVLVTQSVIRFQNSSYQMMINLLGLIICTLSFWLFGYSFAFGSSQSGLIGSSKDLYALQKLGTNLQEQNNPSHWLQQWLLCLTALNIFNGITAERFKFLGYLIFSLIFCGFIYPIQTHWTQQSRGWLQDFKDEGFVDFYGATSFTIIGGTSGLVGTLLLRPRRERFDPKNQINKFQVSSIPLLVIGILFIWYSLYVLSILSIDIQELINPGVLIGKIQLNLTLGAVGGGTGAIFLNRIWKYLPTNYQDTNMNISFGLIAGIISASGACNQVHAWAAFTIGVLGGMLSFIFKKLIYKWHVDDPTYFISSFLISGAWSGLATGVFANNDQKGLIYGGGLIGVQSLGVFILFVTSGVLSGFILFVLNLKKLNLLRQDMEMEEKGYDNLCNQDIDEESQMLTESISEIYATKGQSLSKLLDMQQKANFIEQVKLLLSDLKQKGKDKQQVELIDIHTIQSEMKNRIIKQKQYVQLQKNASQIKRTNTEENQLLPTLNQ